ncbi:MAG: chromosome segregation protein SMC [Pseudomonadota bacterium]
MKFTQLRLAGFKSFVEPAELRIDAGLTGVIGPNGCGKSNLLEALRWVMGATSAKSLRGGGMEDVIFAGTDSRPSRDHAEVTLWVDNTERTAPARFNDADLLQVVRRIARGKGSDYKINGEDVRAKDVQLLFADAGTGANSPALVRQGQISELINAKPENRRRVLEEAAGVAGLRARRREAQLKLNAAEANLDRLAEIVDELDSRYQGLQRQARQASRYRKLSGQIREFEALVWLRRWRDAHESVASAEAEHGEIEAVAAEAIRIAASAASAAEAASSTIQPLREAEAEAAAALRLIERERDGLERDLETARSEITRLEARLVEIDAGAEREAHLADEAAQALERVHQSLERVREDGKDDQGAQERAEAALAHADEQRAAAEKRLDLRAAESANHRAALEAARRTEEQTRARLQRAEAEHARAAKTMAECEAAAPPDLHSSQAEADAARQAAETARAAVETARAQLTQVRERAEAAREAAQSASAEAAGLDRERASLERLLASSGDEAGVLDAVTAQHGFEKALAAALGDDLEASLDTGAARRWTGSAIRAQAFAGEVTPLDKAVEAPRELAARLAAIGVVDSPEAAERLAGALQPGQRLVTREGGLYRWDGFQASAGAPSAAAVRLETRNRLTDLKAEIATAERRSADNAETADEAASALQTAREAEAKAETGRRSADAALSEAERRLASASAEAALEEARRANLAEALSRAEAARDEAAEEAKAAEAAYAELNTADDGEALLGRARQDAETARSAAADARAALESVKREAQGRRHRVASLEREEADWRRRSDAARERVEALKAKRSESEAGLETARNAPEAIEARRSALYDALGAAESKARHARDAVVEAEARNKDVDSTLRAAEREASAAREARAAASAKLDAARERIAETGERLQDATGETPEALGVRVDGSEYQALSAQEIERRLDEARLARERLGAVNLRADEEAEELNSERQRLSGERDELTEAVARLRKAVDTLSREGRARLLEAFDVVDGHFRNLFVTLFGGGSAELQLTESHDPLEAGLEIMACPPGKKLQTMSLMSGGEQALTATALIFAIFLSNPSPVCVLDEVDAPLDDANVDRYCRLLDEMRRLTDTRFLVITHNAVTMARMDRLFGVTMAERGISQLVSVNLKAAEALAAAE